MNSSIGENVLLFAMIIWTLFWKCYSVWIASKNNHKKWFIALLVLNTVGILDMIYIFGVVKKKPQDIKNVLKTVLKIK